MAGPKDPAAASGDQLRAGHADREQVIETLKDAFVNGLLTRDELDTRAGRALTAPTRADLAALTADIPAVPPPRLRPGWRGRRPRYAAGRWQGGRQVGRLAVGGAGGPRWSSGVPAGRPPGRGAYGVDAEPGQPAMARLCSQPPRPDPRPTGGQLTAGWPYSGRGAEAARRMRRSGRRGKQAQGWHLEQPEPGVLIWRTPSGRTYATSPTVYPM